MEEEDLAKTVRKPWKRKIWQRWKGSLARPGKDGKEILEDLVKMVKKSWRIWERWEGSLGRCGKDVKEILEELVENSWKIR